MHDCANYSKNVMFEIKIYLQNEEFSESVFVVQLLFDKSKMKIRNIISEGE